MRDLPAPKEERTPESIVAAFVAGEMGGHTVNALKRAAHEIRVIEGIKKGARPFNKEHIKPGRIFTDCKGNIRKIVDIGPHLTTYAGQTNNDCCQYVPIVSNYKSSARVGCLYNTTRLNFSIWAKQEVTAEYLLENGLNDYDIKRKKFIPPKTDP